MKMQYVGGVIVVLLCGIGIGIFIYPSVVPSYTVQTHNNTENFNDTYNDQSNMIQKADDVLWAEGDVGENPPEESVNWPLYTNDAHKFHFQYPPEYRVVEDVQGWPHAIVHLMRSSDGQPYDITVEVWEGQDDAQTAGRLEPNNPYFSMVEHPVTGEFISLTCWHDAVASDCKNIYLTFGF